MSATTDALEVAIVGGGIAGTYAAYRLRNANKRIGLFECSNRIGGRLFTYHLPCCPSVNIELGGMRFIPKKHKTLNSLITEMDIPSVSFSTTDSNTKPSTLFFFRGQHLSIQDILHGKIPYALNAEEKENQHRLENYYLEKLLGLNDDRSLLQRVQDPEVEAKLQSMRFETALDLVASPEGKAFMLKKRPVAGQLLMRSKCSALMGFRCIAYFQTQDVTATLNSGMSSLPVKLIECFEESSEMNRTFLHHRLISIHKTEDKQYLLKFQLTSTKNDHTMSDVKDSFYTTLAKCVILALPVAALEAIKWTPFQEISFQNEKALIGITKICKIFLAFNQPWWRDCGNSSKLTISDEIFQVSSDFGGQEGAYVLLASYSVFTDTFRTLQSQGKSIQGSAPGDMRVSTALKDFLLDRLCLAYKVPRSEIPDPIGGVAYFWDSSSYGGGLQSWESGFLDQGVSDRILRPMPTEDVFVVGTDVAAKTGYEMWIEGALCVVDELLSRKFLWS